MVSLETDSPAPLQVKLQVGFWNGWKWMLPVLVCAWRSLVVVGWTNLKTMERLRGSSLLQPCRQGRMSRVSS